MTTETPASKDTAKDHGAASRIRAQIALLLGLVYLCGLLSGVLGRRLFAAQHPPALGEARSQPFFALFTRTFDLTLDQRRKLRIILDERERSKEVLWTERFMEKLPPGDRERLEEEDRKADRRIEAMLTPRQREGYRKMLISGTLSTHD